MKIEGKLAVEYGLALNLVNNNSNKHILVVDDESDIVDVIRFCLQMMTTKHVRLQIP